MKVRSDQLKNAIILVAFGVILLWVLDNLNALWGVLLMLFSLVSPFIIGIVIAFIMNVPMRYFERTLLKQLPHKLKRATSYLITLIIILLIIFITLIIVVPELTSSVQEIAHRTPQAWNNFLNWLERTNIIENEYVGEFVKNISLDWPKIEQKAISLLSARASNWIVSTFNVATSLIGAIASLLIGYVFSIYVLLQKEKLLCQTKKISIALFPKKIHRKLSYLSDLTNTTFSNFLSGQLLEAIIVGVMFFIAMKIFRFPYALVVSLLTGISSFIPVIGPIIGAIIGALLIMVHDVRMAFWFIIMSIAIQQLEGNLIYPNVAGKAVGLPAIWVLVAITIGGSLFGGFIRMELLYVTFTTIGSIITLFILTKIMGNKQMSQLSMFDYIIGITIGSIAAEMATNLEEFEKPLIAMIIYALFALLISIANYKSIAIRRIITGKSLVLFEDGKLYEGNLRKARIDINEFLMECRNNGYFNIANLQSAILETNGKISFLPLSTERPVTPKDLNLTPKKDKPVINVIIDGHVMEGNLDFCGKNINWLNKQLQAQGVDNVSDVFLATCDNDSNLNVYLKINKKMSRDMFQ